MTNRLLAEYGFEPCFISSCNNLCLMYPVLKTTLGIETALKEIYYPGVELFKTFVKTHQKQEKNLKDLNDLMKNKNLGENNPYEPKIKT